MYPSRRNLALLWRDELGFIVSSELLLIGTIPIIGLIVGLTAVRGSVVQELGDFASAIGKIDQTYLYLGITKANGTQETQGSAFDDMADECDAADTTSTGGNGVTVVALPGDPDE